MRPTSIPFVTNRLILSFAMLFGAGCGGGATGSSPVPPHTTLTSQAQLKVLIPGTSSTSGGARRSLFVSPSTNGIAVTVYATGTAPPASPQLVFDVSAQSSACTTNPDGSRTCLFLAPAPVGTDDIRLDLYDAAPSNGIVQGKLLGTGTAFAQQISPSVSQSVNIVIGGVASKFVIQPFSVTALADGNQHEFTAGINLSDADGNIIVGADPLAQPITLNISNDPNNTLTLSEGQITTPAGAQFVITYNGGQLSNGKITATSGQLNSSLSVQPFNYQPSTLDIVDNQPTTVIVSDAGYSGPFQATSGSCAAISPTSASASPSGAPVVFTVTPVSNGTCDISVAGRLKASIPVTVQLPSGSTTIPATTNWLVVPRSETVTAREADFAGTFTAGVSGGSACISVAPASAQSVNGSATFTVTARSEGNCTLVISGHKSQYFSYSVKSDDVLTFAQNQMRTGLENKSSAISKSNIYQLTPRWSYWAAAGIHSSPLVANGLVYIETNHGDVRALDAKTGAVVWSVQPFGSNANITMTPAIDAGFLFVGQHDPEGTVLFAALDALTGQTVWTTQLAGAIRAEPAFVNGVVIIGTAGGDAPECYQGGVFGLDEMSGRVIWHWVVDPTANDGGSVWSPITYDGTNVIFGTGNTCSPSAAVDVTSNAVVALNPQSGSVSWVASIQEPQTNDNDIGGGEMEYNGRVYVTSKNGNFYILDASNGNIVSTIPLGSKAGYGGIGTPSTDGSTIIVSGGFRSDVGAGSYGDGSFIYGLDMNGVEKWMIGTSEWPVQTSVTINNGIAYAGLDNQISALDVSSGNVLWSYPLDNATDRLYAAVAVTESGVYAASEQGFVYAFGVGDTALPNNMHPLSSLRKPAKSR